MKKTVFAIAAVLASVNVAYAGGDAAAGEAKAAACAGCHGAEGVSAAPTFPTLAGQHASYLEKTLQDYKSGARKNAIMAGMAAGLSDDDIANLAAFYASKPSTLSHMAH